MSGVDTDANTAGASFVSGCVGRIFAVGAQFRCVGFPPVGGRWSTHVGQRAIWRVPKCRGFEIAGLLRRERQLSYNFLAVALTLKSGSGSYASADFDRGHVRTFEVPFTTCFITC